MKKGSMTYVKKGLGIGLLLIAGGAIFNIEQINSMIGLYPMAINIILVASGYFLLITGRQR